MAKSLTQAMQHRFGEIDTEPFPTDAPDVWKTLAGHASCRKFTGEKVPTETVKALAAVALSTPSKSDLQQRDIIIIENNQTRANLIEILTSGPLAQAWIADAPTLLVICGNNRRQRQIHEQHNKPFMNDHLDAFYNPVMDAGIALAGFIMAAEAIGLGCCPISAVRNDPQKVSALLSLPEYVFPAVGLAIGYPAEHPAPRARLPLSATVHVDQFDDTHVLQQIETYVRRRNELDGSIWSEQKTNQYSRPERQEFGSFVTDKGFRLD